MCVLARHSGKKIMALVSVLNKIGEPITEIDLRDDIFAVEINPGVLHEVVVMQLARRRSGTACVKNRSDVSYSGVKMYRQKGTGRARRGDRKSPLLKGGGVIFGPHPRSYDYSVPKKVRRLALKMALSSKLAENTLKVLDDLALERKKTKDMAQILDALGLKKVLFITGDHIENAVFSARNIPGVKVLPVAGLNVYDILKHDHLVLESAAVEGVYGRLG